MKVKKFIYLLVIIIALSITLTYISYKGFYKDIKIDEINMDLNVTSRKNAYGVNIDSDAIHLGMLPLGAASTRHLDIVNNYNYTILFYITKDNSELSSIVDINPNYFVLKPKENKTIDVSATVPENFKPKHYYGKLNIMIRVPFFRK